MNRDDKKRREEALEKLDVYLGLLTVADVAKLFHFSAKTASRRLEDKSIPGVKVGDRWYTTRKLLDKMLQPV